MEADLAINNSNTYVKSGLTPGLVYKFKVQARNVLEYGEQSEELSVLAGTLPSRIGKPSIKQTDNDDIEINWEAPDNEGGGPLKVIGYGIEFETRDGDWKPSDI